MKIFKWNLIDDYDKMCLQNGLVREYKKRLEILEKEEYIKMVKLTEAEKEIERLKDIIEEIRKIIKWSYEEHEFQGAIHSIEELIKEDN